MEVRKKCLSVPRSEHLQKGSDADLVREDIYQQMKFLFGEQVGKGNIIPENRTNSLFFYFE